MYTVLKLAVRDEAAPTPQWLDRILAEHPDDFGPDGVPNMRRAGCLRMRSELHGKATAVLVFEWSDQPLPGALDHDAFVDWWGRESGWDYKVETSPTRPDTPSGALGTITYEPDVNGRPCVPP